MARISERGKSGKMYAEFDSINDVFRTIARMNWTPQREKASNRTAKSGNSFNVFRDLAHADDVFKNHPEQIRVFSVKDEKISHIESAGNEVLFDVTGDYIDIDKYLEGVPEVMGNATMGNPKSIFATINVLNSMVYSLHADYQLVKAKRVMRLVDWLENQNIRVQVVMTDDSEINFTRIIVKQFQDPFDLNQLAVALHPEFFRRTCFLIKEQSKTWGAGYGSAHYYDEKMKKYVANPDDGLYIYVGGYMPYKEENNDHGAAALNRAFDDIEAGVLDMINSGMTYSERPLTITGLDW